MPGTVIPNLTDISLCEAVGSWSGTPTPALQDVLLYTAKQGDRCLQSYSAGAAVRNARWDFGAGTPASFSGKFLYLWMAFSMKNYTTGTGTITIRMTDTTGLNREWDIFNKDSLPHIGWIGWCIHGDHGFDREDSGFNITQVRYVGWLLADSAKGKVYIYWDAWRFGTGLSIKAGTSEDPAKFEDFYDNAADVDELTMAWGVIDKIAGVYFVKGQIAIGSMTINENTYFKDLNQLIIFQDIKGTPQGVYGIKGQRYDGGTGTTKIFLGEAGISGGVIRASSAMKFKVDMSDLGVIEFGFHGCVFLNADTITLPVYNDNKIMQNCNFTACQEILASTTKIEGCNFISSPGKAIRISSASHKVKNCNFIKCQTAIHHDVGGSQESPLEYDYDNLKFTDNSPYDIENSALSPNYYILIDRLNGSNPTKINNSNGGYTTFKEVWIHFIFTIKNEALVSVTEYEWRIYDTAGGGGGKIGDELAGEESASSATQDYEYDWMQDINIAIQIIHDDYSEEIVYDKLTSNNKSITIILKEEKNTRR